MKAVFVDTGLEYPEIRDFVKTFDNVDWLKPKLNFRKTIDKYGYPLISKEVSEKVCAARSYLNTVLNEMVQAGGARNIKESEGIWSICNSGYVFHRPQSKQEQSRLPQLEDGEYP